MFAPNSSAPLSEDAQADYINILLHTLETWGERQMDISSEHLERALESIAENPAIGRSRGNLRPGLRSLVVGRHLIFYQIEGTTPVVARILHERMDPERHLGH